MNQEEYLMQIGHLEKEVLARQMEIRFLRERMERPISPGFEEHLFHSNAGDASHVRTLSRVWQLEEELSDRCLLLERLREQALMAISTLSDPTDRLVLQERFLANKTYASVARSLYVSKTTVHNWVRQAARKMELPREPIRISERNEQSERDEPQSL